MSNFELSRFFHTIWKGESGVVKTATRKQSGLFTVGIWEWPAQEAGMVEYLEACDAAKEEVYFSPDLFTQEAQEKRKVSRQYVKGSHVICLDFDGNAPDLSVWDNDEGMYEGVPKPSIVVRSSTPQNMHMYWVLDKFETDIDRLELMRKTVTYKLKADESGWDAGQLLRPPYTTNYGYTKPNREETYDVFIEELSDRVYPASDFPIPNDFRPLVNSSIDETTLPPVLQILADHTFVPGFTELYIKSREDIATNKRSDTLMALAYYCAESGLSDSEIYAVVQDADNRWGKYSHRTDKHRRYCDIVERARGKFPLGSHLPPESEVIETQENKTLLYNWEQILNSELEIQWYLEGLLSTTGYGMLTGVPGVGKTQLAMRLGTSIALGTDFLHWKNKQGPARVLMFSLEMGLLDIKQFMRKMTDLQVPETLHALSQNFYIYPMNKPIIIDNPKKRMVFEHFVEQVKPRVIIIDSLIKAVDGNLSDQELANNLNTYLGDLRRKYGCAIVVVHHSKKIQDPAKNKMYQGDLDILYGSRYLGSDADFVLTFAYGKEQHELTGYVSKMRFSAVGPPFGLTRTEDLNFDHRIVETDVPQGLLGAVKQGIANDFFAPRPPTDRGPGGRATPKDDGNF